MKFLIPGVLAGFILNLFILHPRGGVEIYPLWTVSIKNIQGIEMPAYPHGEYHDVFVNDRNTVHIIKKTGMVKKIELPAENLYSFSGNGKFYVRYDKVGDHIEFFNIGGDRFWRIKSREYPYLSRDGRLIFLLNGDHSRVRFIDFNGNEIGVRQVYGRLCTVISFTDSGNRGALGFADGRYFIIDEKGQPAAEGKVPGKNVVKGIAVSGNGRYGAVHYGGADSDSVLIVDIEKKAESTIRLDGVHSVKTSLHITDEGDTTIFNSDSLLNYSSYGGLNFRIRVPEKRPGDSRISFNGRVYCATYTMADGFSRMIIFRNDGNILLSREFAGDSFLVGELTGTVVLLRGSDNLYCYSLFVPAL